MITYRLQIFLTLQERRPVTLSAAKGLARRTQRSFAALRACPERSEGMTARTPFKLSQMSIPVAEATYGRRWRCGRNAGEVRLAGRAAGVRDAGIPRWGCLAG